MRTGRPALCEQTLVCHDYSCMGVSSCTVCLVSIRWQQCSLARAQSDNLATNATNKIEIPPSGSHRSKAFSNSSNICIRSRFGPFGMYSALSKPGMQKQSRSTELNLKTWHEIKGWHIRVWATTWPSIKILRLYKGAIINYHQGGR